MSLKEKINLEKLPKHVAIIMDGNGRWATSRGLERKEGHIEGAKTVREICTAARELGIAQLTLYAFSIENWKRPQDEINALMYLLSKSLREETSTLNKNGIRLKVIGDLSYMDSEVRAELDECIKATAANEGMDLVLALSYGGRHEIVQAAKQLAEDAKNGKVDLENFGEKDFENYLYTKSMPSLDLLIRTSGELRLSNFLLWQVAYSELYFTELLWPEFHKEAFFEAIISYQNRERRFGKV